MNPATGSFITMDAYQGDTRDPVTLHKYLYANANPVTYSDPTGYFGLASFSTGLTVMSVLSTYAINPLLGTVNSLLHGTINNMLWAEASPSQTDYIGEFIGVVQKSMVNRAWDVAKNGQYTREAMVEDAASMINQIFAVNAPPNALGAAVDAINGATDFVGKMMSYLNKFNVPGLDAADKVLGVINKIAEILKSVALLVHTYALLQAIGTLYGSGSIGVTYARCLYRITAGSDAEAAAAHKEMIFWNELGMFDLLAPALPDITAAVFLLAKLNKNEK
jgi:hypothetical protein